MRNGVQVVLNVLISLEVIPLMKHHTIMFDVETRDDVYNLVINYNNKHYTDLNNIHNQEEDNIERKS